MLRDRLARRGRQVKVDAPRMGGDEFLLQERRRCGGRCAFQVCVQTGGDDSVRICRTRELRRTVSACIAEREKDWGRRVLFNKVHERGQRQGQLFHGHWPVAGALEDSHDSGHDSVADFGIVDVALWRGRGRGSRVVAALVVVSVGERGGGGVFPLYSFTGGMLFCLCRGGGSVVVRTRALGQLDSERRQRERFPTGVVGHLFRV